MPPGYVDTKLTVTIGLFKVALLNGAFTYECEMIDSHDRLSNRSKDSCSRKPLIGAHDCVLQPAFCPFVVERLHLPWRPFIRSAYDQGSIQ